MSDYDLTDRSIFPVWSETTVRYSDLDPNSHVNNGAISAYFEDGRVRLRTEHLATPENPMLAGFAIAQVTIKFRMPLTFPNTVDIGSSIIHIGRTCTFSGSPCLSVTDVLPPRRSLRFILTRLPTSRNRSKTT